MSIGSAKTSVSKLAEDTWMKVEQLGEVTGAPTRDHWKVSRILFFFISCHRDLMVAEIGLCFFLLGSLSIYVAVPCGPFSA